MLKEYAVDPEVVGSDFQNCRYILSLFGIDKGRLISRFPKKWKNIVYEAAEKLPDGLKKNSILDMVNNLDKDKLVLTKSNRAYPEGVTDWLSSAIKVHKSQPFTAILSHSDDLENGVHDAELIVETDFSLQSQVTFKVRREASAMAEPLRFLALNAKYVRFVDPYFDPSQPKWRLFPQAFLRMLPTPQAVEIEYHTQFRDRPNERPASPIDKELIRRLEMFAKVLPHGSTMKLYRWRAKEIGERFHRRFVMIEKSAGVQIEGGLDVNDKNPEQTTDMTFIAGDFVRDRWADYNIDSDCFELVKPILIVDHLGNVERYDV